VSQGADCRCGFRWRLLTVGVHHTYYVIAGNVPVLVHNEGGGPIPLGFDSENSYLAFVESLNGGLSSAGYGGATAAFQGSAVTGVGYTSGAPFGAHGDYDIALGGDDIFNAARGAGIGLRSGGTRTGPLTSAQLRTLGSATFLIVSVLRRAVRCILWSTATLTTLPAGARVSLFRVVLRARTHER